MSKVIEDLSLIGSVRFRKARALLFYLHHHPGIDHRGEKIADIFWQNYPRKKAMASLRQTIRQVREVVVNTPRTILETQRGYLGLRCESGETLEKRVMSLLSSPSWMPGTTEAVERYFQEFDLILGLSDPFDSWLAIKRVQALQEFADYLDGIILKSDDTALALQAARLAKTIEPANENAVRFLMHYDWAQNSAHRAIETYNTLYNYLDRELDQEPEEETMALVATIKSNLIYPSGLDRESFRRPQVRPSLSLEKVQTSGLSSAEESLLSALYHDLRMRVSRFREWKVVDDGETSKTDLKIKIALNSFADDNKLAIELSAPASNALIWSEVVSSPTSDWDEKARTQLANISRALSYAVRKEEAVVGANAIYDRWLQSQTLIDMWSPKTEARAIDMLGQITLEAPKFGPAHAELAGALNVRHILLPGTQHTEEQKQRALHHALEAVSLDPLDTRAHRVLAWCYSHKSEFELAEFHFDQAKELNRSSTLTLASCALGYAFAGQLELASELATEIARKPEALEPFHFVYLAAVNYLCGDFEASVSQCESAGDLMATVGGWHTASLVQLGRISEARARLVNYNDFMKNNWTLEQTPTSRASVDWFVSCFPLRSEAVREELTLTLNKAM